MIWFVSNVGLENLYIEATISSPTVDFDYTTHTLEINGESYPENTAEFYDPVLSWLEEYLEDIEDDAVIVNLDIPYFNSSSSKVLMDLMTCATRSGTASVVSYTSMVSPYMMFCKRHTISV